ncbi:hypothetical protein JW935_06355 [candidate division KSB1 bacterium]|nr:hypothetical protein [candidate division KSB1 bacterium]
MITSENIKNLILSSGADLCGIASVDRFRDAPEGFHPLDVYEKTQSALNGVTVDQKKCRPLSNFCNERGYVLKMC